MKKISYLLGGKIAAWGLLLDLLGWGCLAWECSFNIFRFGTCTLEF
jgi:hypothetical protein